MIQVFLKVDSLLCSSPVHSKCLAPGHLRPCPDVGAESGELPLIRSIIKKERDCRWRRPALACSSLSLRSQSGGLAWCSFSSSNRRLPRSLHPILSCLSRGGRRVSLLCFSLLCFHFLPHPEGCPRVHASAVAYPQVQWRIREVATTRPPGVVPVLSS